MFAVLTLFIIVSCVTLVSILSYCKSRITKSTEAPATRPAVRSGSSQPRPRQPSVFVVPTTSQVMQMYLSQSNPRGQTTESICPERPPSYGHVIVDVPPSYEQVIEGSRS